MTRHPVAPIGTRRSSEHTAREVFFAMLLAFAGGLLFAASRLGLLAA